MPFNIAQLQRPFDVLAAYAPHQNTLCTFFETRAAADSDRPCIVFQDKTWSWGEFSAQILRTAHALCRLGIQPGDRVAVMATNSPLHVLLLFALARIRATLVPVNPEFGVAEARYVLEHAGVSGIVVNATTSLIAREAANAVSPAPWFVTINADPEGMANLDELIESAPNVPLPEDVSPEDTCAIIYTSGTTGFPKGAMHSQRGFCLTGERHMERCYLQRDSRVLVVLPMFHVNALFYSVAGTIAAGGCLIIAPRFSASAFWRYATDTGATVTNLMSIAFNILMKRPRSEFVPEHKVTIINGGPLTREIVETFQREFGITRLVEGFGMTEIPGAFSTPLDKPQTYANMGLPGRHPDHGRKWTEARVVDDSGNDLADDECGELWVCTPTVMQGYYRDPEQTAQSFSGNWFKTGDLVKRKPDGYFTFVTRKKDIIRRRGENIAGAELDRVISQHPAVGEVAVIPVPCPLSGEEALAAVIVKTDAIVTAEEIRDWCAARLAAFKVPRYVAFVTDLPHTPTHKVAKHILKQNAEHLRTIATDLAPTG